MSSAELTLWARIDGLAPDAVQSALWEERTLVRTWAMRGTLHLLPARDYSFWQAALSTHYERFTKPAWSRASGVSPDELEELIAAIRDALDGTPLTREELADAVGSDRLRESWGALLKPAAVRGVLCDFKPLIYRAQGWISAVVDGRIEGVWRHERRGRRLAVEIEPFTTKLSKPVRAAAEAEPERLAEFMGGALALSWAPDR